jgi:hypothetical protein
MVSLTAIALMTVGILMTSSSLARRNMRSIDEKSAFYIAEAGLSEAYLALSVGKLGQIGSRAAPALFGEGLYWVDSTALADGTVQLMSTGMCGGSRVELGLVVARLESAVARQGFFSETMLSIDQGTFADSYDSRAGPYEDQGQSPANTRTRLGSNGDIEVHASAQAPTQILGNLVPGVGASALIDPEASVTGTSEPRSHTTILPRVEVPAVESLPAVRCSDPLPYVIPSGSVGYESLTVEDGSTIRILGPATVVVGSLEAADGSEIEFDTTDGAIELFVLESAAFAPGASVINTTGDPTALSIQVAATRVEGAAEPALALDSGGPFHGFVYAPRATARFGAALEFFGGAVADTLELAPTARLHYDLALQAAANRTGTAPLAMSWRLVGIQQSIGLAGLDPFRALGLDRATLAPPSLSHDLAGVGIKTTYVDLFGATRKYRGPESGFDWSQVRSVVDIVRSSPVTYVTGVVVVSNGTMQVGD